MSTELRDLLERVVGLLDTAGIPFMVVGSFASTAHGMPRTTQDLDVVIDPPTPGALDDFVRSMAPERYYVDADAARDALRRRSMFNAVDLASGWKVDLVIIKNRAFSREEFARRIKLTLLGVPLFVASPADTIVAKLEWSKQSGGSQRQRRDVAGILATLGSELERDHVERWVQDLNLEDEWQAAQATPI